MSDGPDKHRSLSSPQHSVRLHPQQRSDRQQRAGSMWIMHASSQHRRRSLGLQQVAASKDTALVAQLPWLHCARHNLCQLGGVPPGCSKLVVECCSGFWTLKTSMLPAHAGEDPEARELLVQPSGQGGVSGPGACWLLPWAVRSQWVRA